MILGMIQYMAAISIWKASRLNARGHGHPCFRRLVAFNHGER